MSYDAQCVGTPSFVNPFDTHRNAPCYTPAMAEDRAFAIYTNGDNEPEWIEHRDRSTHGTVDDCMRRAATLAEDLAEDDRRVNAATLALLAVFEHRQRNRDIHAARRAIEAAAKS